MGKYMRKGKGVGKMGVIEGSLGVRTRARALALQRDSKQGTGLTHGGARDKQLEPCVPMECCLPSSLPIQTEITSQEPQPNYMDLRSRRFEKTSARIVEESPSLAANDISRENLSESRKSAGGTYQMHKSPQSSLQHDSRCVSRQASLKSSAIDAGRLNLRARVTPTTSTSNSVSMANRGPIGILTRHQRQALAQLAGTKDMQIQPGVDPSNSVNLDSHVEGEQFFGESLMVTGPSSKDWHGRRTRESTPDSYAWSMDAPGSTSRPRRARRSQGRSLSAPPFNRANEAPSTSEIEAFFEGVEQQEQRRFIERYNFDPVSERPLRGRYEWTNT